MYVKNVQIQVLLKFLIQFFHVPPTVATCHGDSLRWVRRPQWASSDGSEKRGESLGMFTIPREPVLPDSC